jgi:hypothetical protein
MQILFPQVTGHGMSLKQFTGDDAIDNQDAYQAAAFDEALKDCDVVVIPAGVPRKPGMTRQDLFSVNANLNKNFAEAVAKNCPNAMVAIISNPVNSTVPIFAGKILGIPVIRVNSLIPCMCFFFTPEGCVLVVLSFFLQYHLSLSLLHGFCWKLARIQFLKLMIVLLFCYPP